MTIIDQTETYLEMADKIYNGFAVMQSCKVEGVVVEEINGRKILHEKGAKVLERIAELDMRDNYDLVKKRRKMKSAGQGTIGGPVAQKIFKSKRTILNDVIRHTIWRLQ